jgi:AAA15 family ATPase/GTPase
MADWMINTLIIENFKSIKELELKPKRVNVFVGKPNTGKSNILEALSLFSALPNGNLKDFVRFEKLRHLFYDGNLNKPVKIVVGSGRSRNQEESIFIYREKESFKVEFLQKEPNSGSPIEQTCSLTDSRAVLDLDRTPAYHFKKYSFRKADLSNKGEPLSSLRVPFGENLYYVLETNPSLFEEVAPLFEQYGLSLVLNQENDSMLIQKKVGHRVYQLPYSLVADTLQRLIFYLAAIKTNSQSILIFEEPETHSFPPYIQRIALEIANSVSNQFFIATHSPYLFNTILEKTPKEDVAIFVVDYEDYQTKVTYLQEEDISELMNYGMDIFFHIDEFIKEKNLP